MADNLSVEFGPDDLPPELVGIPDIPSDLPPELVGIADIPDIDDHGAIQV